MVWIPGGTFRRGSDRHYPEEAPIHRVTVDGFQMDRTPVTNRQFKRFVKASDTSRQRNFRRILRIIPAHSRTCSMPVRWLFVHPSSTFDLRDWSHRS